MPPKRSTRVSRWSLEPRPSAEARLDAAASIGPRSELYVTSNGFRGAGSCASVGGGFERRPRVNHNWIKLIMALVVTVVVAVACSAQPGAGDQVSNGAAEETTSEQASDEQVDANSGESSDVDEVPDTEVLGIDQEAPAAESGDDVDGDDAAEVEREFAGQVLEVTGPEISPGSWNAIQRALDVFGGQTGAEVIYTGLGDWEAEMAVRIEADRAPAVSIFPQPNLITEFASNGSIVELPDEVTSAVADAWAPAHLEAGNDGGTQFAVPVDAAVASAVWYDTNVFGAGGYSVPETVTELEQLTNVMISDGVVPWCIASDASSDVGAVFSNWVEAFVLSDHGRDVYDQWTVGAVAFSDPRIVGTLAQVRNLWTTPGAVHGGLELVTSGNGDEAADLVARNCAMTLQDADFARDLPADAEHIDWFAFPASGDDGGVIVDGRHVAAFSNTPAALALVEFMASADYAQLRQSAQRSVIGNRHSSFSTANAAVDLSLWSDRNAAFVEFLTTVDAVRPDVSNVLANQIDTTVFTTQATAFVSFQITAGEIAGALDAARQAQ